MVEVCTPMAMTTWFAVSATECKNSENMVCDFVYFQATNLTTKHPPFLKRKKKKKKKQY